MNDLEHKIREDLVAAGIEPDKYLGPRQKEERANPDQDLYFCDKCDQGWYRSNLHCLDGCWYCARCERLQEEKSANG